MRASAFVPSVYRVQTFIRIVTINTNVVNPINGTRGMECNVSERPDSNMIKAEVIGGISIKHLVPNCTMKSKSFWLKP